MNLISSSTETCLLLFWLNIAEIVAINYFPIVYKLVTAKLQRHDLKDLVGTLIVCLTLIIALTHKPHNILLIGVLLYTCQKLDQTCTLLFTGHPKQQLLIKVLVHIWLGKAVFFYQGNSNSLATIDLTAGYIGLKSFKLAPVAILLTINTYSGPILSFLSFIYHFYDCYKEQSMQSILHVVCLIIAVPFVTYTFIILAFREHLFIWSVFSPKLLYESYYLGLMLILSIFAYLFHCFE